MNRLKRSILVCMLAIALTALLTAEGVQAAGLTSAQWRIVKSPNVSGSVDDTLFSVATVSATNIWAVGSYTNSAGTDLTLIEHWNGTNWQVVPSPSPSVYINVLFSVTAVSANNIWAVGYNQGGDGGAYLTLIEHWNGTNWQLASGFDPGSSDNRLFSVTAISANNIWAVGSYYGVNHTAAQTLIEHWNGTSWQLVSSPSPGSSDNRLFSVTAVSASNIWAVGSYTNSNSPYQTLTEHWNGTSWKVVPSPNPGSAGNELSSVTTVSATDLWAVGGGYTNSKGTNQQLIEHWNGTSWKIVPSPSIGGNLTGVAVISATDLWAVGDYFGSTGSKTLTEHYS